MKSVSKLYIAIFSALTMLFACSEDKTTTTAEDQYKDREDDYLAEIHEKDSVIKEVFTSMDEIEEEINVVKLQENISTITTTDAELTTAQKEKIKQDIRVLGDLLAENKKNIASLRKTIARHKGSEKDYSAKISDLEKTLALREEAVLGYQSLIAQLDKDVKTLTYKVDSLKNENRIKADNLYAQDRKMNTAWYIIGTRRELKDNGSVTPTGGVLGIGRTLSVNAGMSKSNMHEINILETTSIPVNSTKLQILSSHPSNAYTLRKEGKKIISLEILDPNEFWKSSKYLVLEVN
ncbi:MAG TPA: hypothetical protein VD905_05670 [Flavobacteriales bacterium]|nr:hypothetical protein [Flavobacteriales bacterium]